MELIEKEIRRYVQKHKEEAIKFLRKLISFESIVINQGIEGKEEKIQSFLVRVLENIVDKLDVFYPDNERLRKYSEFNEGHNYEKRPNVVGILKGKDKGRSIILNGHVDTVDVGNVNLWKYNPFSGKIEDNKIYGRGSVDMKGGLASFILAVKFLKNLGFKLKGDVILQCVVDEEGGGNGTLACVDRGYKADAAIVAEPTNLKIVIAHRGAMHLRVKVKGKSTHACFKWEGVNAIEKMIKIINSLNELEKEYLVKKTHKFLPSPTIMVGEIKGGVAASIVPDECEIKVDVKYLPNESKEKAQREVENCIKNVIRCDKWLSKNKVEIVWTLNTSPYEISEKESVVKVIFDSASKFIKNPVIGGLPSGADARILNNIGKIPTIIFGPGNLKDAHSINESLNLDEFIKSIKIFMLFLIEWCGF